MLFRIVRINGDGTIRIVTDGSVGKSKFNEYKDLGEKYPSGEEYLGYTYKTRIGYRIGKESDDEASMEVVSTDSYYFSDKVTIDRINGEYTLVNPVLHTGEECFNNKELCEGKYTQFSDSPKKNDRLYKITEFISEENVKYKYYHYSGEPYYDLNSSNDSTIKKYLDGWYSKYMMKYDSLFVSTRYCNDTTSSPGLTIYYGSIKRVETHNPSYICPETDKTYGGEYILKVGLLSGDEAAFAGGLYFCAETDFYLSGTSEIKILMSPVDYIRSINYTFGINEKGRLYAIAMGSYNDVVPVLNLRKDITFTKGVGTKEDPYTIIVE